MTDKEMAEEQVKKWDSILYPELYPVALVKDFIRKAFIAGLKAGRPKWHDLRKNPNDLPNVEGGWVCNQDGYPCFFDWHTEQWLDTEGTQITTVEWCNIPHISQIRSDYVCNKWKFLEEIE